MHYRTLLPQVEPLHKLGPDSLGGNDRTGHGRRLELQECKPAHRAKASGDRTITHP
jgi:hypothetical protein